MLGLGNIAKKRANWLRKEICLESSKKAEELLGEKNGLLESRRIMPVLGEKELNSKGLKKSCHSLFMPNQPRSTAC